MKISIIGAGNVGGTTALRIAEQGLSDDIVMFDVVPGLAKGKSLDLADSQSLVGKDYNLEGTDNIARIEGSSIVVITAGLARKPGMKREDLLKTNAEIVKGISLNIKQYCPEAIVIVVTNPVDILTLCALKNTGFDPKRVLGMGISLDASRLANLIADELKVNVSEVQACVIGSHGEGMVPLIRFSNVKDKPLDKIISAEKASELTKRTVGRGAEIVSCLGSGSAYYAPSAAVADIVKALVKDEKRVIGICAYLNGEYGLKDLYVGVPCRLGREGVLEVIKLDLNQDEQSALNTAAASIKEQTKILDH